MKKATWACLISTQLDYKLLFRRTKEHFRNNYLHIYMDLKNDLHDESSVNFGYISINMVKCWIFPASID